MSKSARMIGSSLVTLSDLRTFSLWEYIRRQTSITALSTSPGNRLAACCTMCMGGTTGHLSMICTTSSDCVLCIGERGLLPPAVSRLAGTTHDDDDVDCPLAFTQRFGEHASISTAVMEVWTSASTHATRAGASCTGTASISMAVMETWTSFGESTTDEAGVKSTVTVGHVGRCCTGVHSCSQSTTNVSLPATAIPDTHSSKCHGSSVSSRVNCMTGRL